MATSQTQRFCKKCQSDTLHARHTFGAGIGILLTILTAGLFLPIWILIAIGQSGKPWRCQACGSGKML